MSCASNTERPDVSIVVVAYNTRHLVEPFFAALDAATHDLSVEVIVVDNASRDGSADLIRQRAPHATIITNAHNIGFGRANNQAVHAARGRYVLLLNTDAFVSPDTLTATVDFMDGHSACGVLGVQLRGADGSAQPSCRYFPTPWNLFVQASGLHRLFPQTQLVDDPVSDPWVTWECDWVPGCYYLVRREVVDAVGLFDPRYFLYYEEVDHCRSVKAAGWKVVYFPKTSVVHIGGESAQSIGTVQADTRQVSALQVESELLYMRKHYGLLGLAAHVILTRLAALINATKCVLRGRGWGAVLGELRTSSRLWDVLTTTQFGLRPTR